MQGNILLPRCQSNKITVLTSPALKLRYTATCTTWCINPRMTFPIFLPPRVIKSMPILPPPEFHQIDEENHNILITKYVQQIFSTVCYKFINDRKVIFLKGIPNLIFLIFEVNTLISLKILSCGQFYTNPYIVIENKLLLRLILKKKIINAVEWFKKIKLSWYFVLQFWHHLPRPQFMIWRVSLKHCQRHNGPRVWSL